MESSTYLLKDASGKDHAIFSGDTLFLGDVGRPDLAQKGADLTQEDLAGYLFDSLRTKIMTLADDVIVYPAHGAGSACGKNMSKETVGSIGDQKQNNYALRADMTKEEFIQELTDGLMPPPAYFPLNVKMNKEGYASFDDVLNKGMNPLSPVEFEAAVNETGALMLDVRNQKDFCAGHVPNSIFIGLDGNFAPWVGELIVDVKQPIVLIAPEGREEEALTRLARVGFDGTLGYLQGGVQAWKASGKDVETLKSISAEEFQDLYPTVKETVFDVRKPGEYQSEHVVDAENTPLSDLNDFIASFPKEGTSYIHCAGGYRSVIASSMLKARGIHNLVAIAGWYGSFKGTTIPRTAYVFPSTL